MAACQSSKSEWTRGCLTEVHDVVEENTITSCVERSVEVFVVPNVVIMVKGYGEKVRELVPMQFRIGESAKIHIDALKSSPPSAMSDEGTNPFPLCFAPSEDSDALSCDLNDDNSNIDSTESTVAVLEQVDELEHNMELEVGAAVEAGRWGPQEEQADSVLDEFLTKYRHSRAVPSMNQIVPKNTAVSEPISKQQIVFKAGLSSQRLHNSSLENLSSAESPARSFDNLQQEAVVRQVRRVADESNANGVIQDWTESDCEGEFNRRGDCEKESSDVKQLHVDHVPLRHVSGSVSIHQHFSRRAEWSVQPGDLSLGTYECIGEGSISVVFRGDLRGEEVAVKMLRTDHGGSESLPPFAADLAEELDVVSMRLQHPNVVRFIGAGVAEAPAGMVAPMIVYEFLGGGSFEDILQARGEGGYASSRSWKPPRRLSLAWGAQLMAALSYLHTFGPCPLAHRDVKPANLLLARDLLTLKLADFSVSTPLRRPAADPAQIPSIAGSMRYMAPEVTCKAPFALDKADVYSAALTCWALVFGRRPYEDVTDPHMVTILAGQGVRPPIPPRYAKLSVVLSPAWDATPHNRPSAGDVAAQLEGMAARARGGWLKRRVRQLTGTSSEAGPKIARWVTRQGSAPSQSTSGSALKSSASSGVGVGATRRRLMSRMTSGWSSNRSSSADRSSPSESPTSRSGGSMVQRLLRGASGSTT